ncbi:MAG: tol-pal system protein YbgF, partial [Hymenobacteraceae bacterium]|nr:tol-pal system protein YbgF [Hymenobacteraceae bacterium]MDX5395394.1 tol-pal system protein YbgF [Hymenobacteraceae bacterium]MDX5511443.1 tol-pal system protein YbgF [Hymenobacteraceae bacterium]
MKKIFLIAGLLITCFFPAFAQEEPAPAQKTDPDTTYLRHMFLEPVDIVPQALDIEGMLLLNRDIQLELEGAVDNMYNFKFDLAEQQFRSLRRRYPDHPMPYFLMGLSNWWKIMPTNIQTQKYDEPFFAYMDTAIVKGEELFEKDKNNAEAAFFLAAAYGFKARLHSERSHWRKATVASKNSLDYLEKSKTGNGLSPEFLFGEALFNYYAVWIHENYTLLRPVLAFFPNGNKNLGVQQLKMVAYNAFYTGTEAKLFLMKIYANEENNSGDAAPIARYLANKYPDNAYFQRFYARLAFLDGNFREAERVST